MAQSDEKKITESQEPQAEQVEAAQAEPQVEELKVEEPQVEEKVEPKPVRTAPPLPEGQHYVWGTGRRKASVARVRIKPGSGKILINKRDVVEYFTKLRDQNTAMAPLDALGMLTSYDIWVNVGGGGSTGQAGAVSLGVARALAKHVPENEHDLRGKGLLTRDARMKERKKPGQPGARKSFQFSKR